MVGGDEHLKTNFSKYTLLNKRILKNTSKVLKVAIIELKQVVCVLNYRSLMKARQ